MLGREFSFIPRTSKIYGNFRQDNRVKCVFVVLVVLWGGARRHGWFCWDQPSHLLGGHRLSFYYFPKGRAKDSGTSLVPGKSLNKMTLPLTFLGREEQDPQKP